MNEKKCSSSNHKEVNANYYCVNCKIYMCNKCDMHHNELFQAHNKFKINEDISEIFTGYCQEIDHLDKLEYFCKNHNKLCCSACISKIKGNGKGEHMDCDICLIENIKEEKTKKLAENVKYLNDVSKIINKSISDLNSLYENISTKKESLIKKIHEIFTKLRNVINAKEDEALSVLEKQFNDLFFKEDLLKKYEKMPKLILDYLNKGQNLEMGWDKGRLSQQIDQCIKIENNIKDINELNKIINEKNNYQVKLSACEYEIEYFNQSLVKLKGNIEKELKLDTDYIDKLKNGYFSTNTIEYELIDNIEIGTEVFLLSDSKIQKHKWNMISYDVFNNTSNCELYIDYKKVGFSKSYQIKDNLKHYIQYKIAANFELKDCRCMFSELRFIKKLTFHKLNMSNVTEMYAMFRYCEKLELIEGMEDWDLSHIENMWCIFSGCYQLGEIKGLENWNISNVTDISGIFECNEKIISLDNIGSWNTSKIKTMCNTFSCCPNLVYIKGIGNWDLSSLSDNKPPFNYSPKINEEVKQSKLYKKYYN